MTQCCAVFVTQCRYLYVSQDNECTVGFIICQCSCC